MERKERGGVSPQKTAVIRRRTVAASVRRRKVRLEPDGGGYLAAKNDVSEPKEKASVWLPATSIEDYRCCCDRSAEAPIRCPRSDSERMYSDDVWLITFHQSLEHFFPSNLADHYSNVAPFDNLTTIHGLFKVSDNPITEIANL